MFHRSTSLAIPHRKSFAAIPSLGSLGTRIAASICHTNRSVKFPLFRHFQDQFLTTNKEKWGKKTDLCFAGLVFLTFRGPLAPHDSNPYPNRSRIARYNAIKKSGALLLRPCSHKNAVVHVKSDPRNRNQKSRAIGNRYRFAIAISQSQLAGWISSVVGVYVHITHHMAWSAPLGMLSWHKCSNPLFYRVCMPACLVAGHN